MKTYVGISNKYRSDIEYRFSLEVAIQASQPSDARQHARYIASRPTTTYYLYKSPTGRVLVVVGRDAVYRGLLSLLDAKPA